MTTGGGETDKRRADIQKTRGELGETVDALAAKADMKARGQETAAQAKNRVRERAAQVGEKTAQRTRTAGRMGARGAKTVRASASRAVTKIRRKPAPIVAVAAAAIAAAVLFRRRRAAAALSTGWSMRGAGGRQLRSSLAKWGAEARQWGVPRG
ncbi:DUF3618 domain-containing protein [Micromonospora sp. NPDC049679]|uniref:DUF3618 domain-containing protein n=1 Tax=Micromonospora sp. NPDC049679 TaxID=3155920 RepID=UPI0033FAA370